MEQRGESSGTRLYRHVAKQHKDNIDSYIPVVNERMFKILMVKCRFFNFFCSKQQVRSTFLTCSIKPDLNTVNQKKCLTSATLEFFLKVDIITLYISCMIIIIGKHVFSC